MSKTNNYAFFNRKELIYFNTLSVEKKLELNSFMEKIKYFQQESEVPLKFRILSLPISEYTKSSVLNTRPCGNYL